ncbi:putative F-box domain, leucine-rich repeat domain, L domain-containing protein [Medicago truncatula]|uniref:Putative F-box domain, leucine-rich repeat domain, L domain-containing protein n=1 Tax=Medicago truncatula TaxID=3880 RepID=A0A396GQK1_MEDTR|nr:F-box/FBD/LRR-repeat protein At5g44980 isoform X2 [Medicago truncatula]RHN40995.1 putative F-box domain, leucine-rich repeat domain, L domain-containing protein [Medicago truncatula]
MERQNKHVVDTDRLSDLPDHVLLHIIEFMNIKQSVQTCVLSKRWKNLWKHLTNLKLHHSYPDNSEIFFKFVSQILSGRNDSISLHSLDFEHEDHVDPPKTTLLEVMRYAASSHNMQQLTVYAKVRQISDLELPPSIFYSRSLTYLKLGFWQIYGSNSGSNYVYDEAHNYNVVLCTPKLTSLTASGHPTFEAPSTHGLPFLEEINIDYTFPYRPCEYSIMISWLQLLANVKIMTLHFKTLFQILCILKMGAQPPCFVRLKSLKVELKSNDDISNGTVRKIVKILLRNSPPARVDIIRKG